MRLQPRQRCRRVRYVDLVPAQRTEEQVGLLAGRIQLRKERQSGWVLANGEGKPLVDLGRSACFLMSEASIASCYVSRTHGALLFVGGPGPRGRSALTGQISLARR